MVSRQQKKAATHRKLQLLRSITNSHAQNNTSVILAASRYIEMLKQTVEILNQNISAAKDSTSQDPLPLVKVEAQEKGFQINVLSEGSCPGLLVLILEALEELGLDVLQARASCSENFHLEAVAEYENREQTENTDGQGVKEAVLQAIQNWRASSEQE
ncbi:hypothetical protein F0562_021570 [Nyssa sinensis]|uniref:Plant bHLH transcription factor ACT-like domain-containing protein n=1 Tax=Nyssa sinensis TaxID=561372 RepID=A0A5J5BLZ6_9ASTE|nr:hypothetical protein F0562_021570 [Nyssa sinensis]